MSDQGIFDEIVAAARRIDLGSNSPGNSPSIVAGFGVPVAVEATGSIYYRQDAPNSSLMLYVRTNNAWTPVSTVAGAGGTATEFVFRPNEPAPAGNVYASWAALVAAAIQQVGEKVVYIDTTLGAATIPAGAWDFLSSTTFAGDPSARVGDASGFQATALAIAAGATLAHVDTFVDLSITSNSAGGTAVITAPATNPTYTFKGQAQVVQAGAGDFIKNTLAQVVSIWLLEAAGFRSGRCFENTNAGATLAIWAFDTGVILTNTLVGVGGATYALLLNSSAVQFNPAQVGLPGGLIAVSLFSLASSTKYTDTAPLLGATQVQAATDVLKAYVVGEPLRFGQQAAVTANVTRYLPFGTGLETTSPGKTIIPIPRLSIYSTIQIDVGASPGIGHATVYTVQKDGVDTGLTVTISGAESTKSATLGGGVTFNPGQFISIKQVTDAGNIQTDSRVTVY